MAHRLYHSLVFSSVMALETVGCALSHEDSPPPPVVMSVPQTWATHSPSDGGPLDAGAEDTGAEDTGAEDAVVDAGAPDVADVDPLLDPRSCEPGWATTKASRCEPLEDGTQECCTRRFDPSDPAGSESCCIVSGRL